MQRNFCQPRFTEGHCLTFVHTCQLILNALFVQALQIHSIRKSGGVVMGQGGIPSQVSLAFMRNLRDQREVSGS